MPDCRKLKTGQNAGVAFAFRQNLALQKFLFWAMLLYMSKGYHKTQLINVQKGSHHEDYFSESSP